MEQEQLTEPDKTLWDNLYKADMNLFKARGKFLRDCTNTTLAIRQALNNPYDRGTALRLLLYLEVEKRQHFLDALVDLASVGHADVGLCREVILSLPKEFLLSNIEKSAEPVLRNAIDEPWEEYRRLLELYIQIDSDLTRRLSTIALQSDDADVREAGEDFFEMLNEL